MFSLKNYMDNNHKLTIAMRGHITADPRVDICGPGATLEGSLDP